MEELHGNSAEINLLVLLVGRQPAHRKAMPQDSIKDVVDRAISDLSFTPPQGQRSVTWDHHGDGKVVSKTLDKESFTLAELGVKDGDQLGVAWPAGNGQ